MYKGVLLSILVSVSCGVEAAILKTINDNETITVNLSSKDPNVISVKNDRIERFSAMKGVLLSHLDSKYGILTLKPSQMLSAEPFSIILFTESGNRITLLIMPLEIPSQDIMLVSNTFENESKPLEQARTYTQEAVELIREMASNSLSSCQVSSVDSTPSHFHQGVMTQIAQCQKGQMIGETIVYKHEDSDKIKLSEQQFHTEDTVAVAIEEPVLGKGDSARVFRVRRHG